MRLRSLEVAKFTSLKYTESAQLENRRKLNGHAVSKLGYSHLQGPPFGFDIMYLALADRNMQVRFGLKVAWES